MTNIVADMKLLVVFNAVMQTRNVSLAAERLGISQPAASVALSRLRDLMADQLFVRRRDRMVPTPLSLSIAASVQDALQDLEQALSRREFDPAVSEWSFDLSVSDHASVVLLPHLVEHIAAVAPNVSLRVEAKVNTDLVELLDSGTIDIAIGIVPELPARFARRRLFSDRYVCMMRRGHPLAGRPLTLDEMLRADHLSVRPASRAEGRADRILAEIGLRRRIVTVVHQFLAAPGMIARSDMITLIFERMRQVINDDDFHFTPLPNGIDMSVQVDAVWNRARGDHEAHRWLRNQISHVTQNLTPVGTDPGQVA